MTKEERILLHKLGEIATASLQQRLDKQQEEIVETFGRLDKAVQNVFRPIMEKILKRRM